MRGIQWACAGCVSTSRLCCQGSWRKGLFHRRSSLHHIIVQYTPARTQELQPTGMQNKQGNCLSQGKENTGSHRAVLKHPRHPKKTNVLLWSVTSLVQRPATLVNSGRMGGCVTKHRRTWNKIRFCVFSIPGVIQMGAVFSQDMHHYSFRKQADPTQVKLRFPDFLNAPLPSNIVFRPITTHFALDSFIIQNSLIYFTNFFSFLQKLWHKLKNTNWTRMTLPESTEYFCNGEQNCWTRSGNYVTSQCYVGHWFCSKIFQPKNQKQFNELFLNFFVCKSN